MRISPLEKFDERKSLYELFNQINELDIPICKPVEFGICDEGVYTIYTWIEGEDADEVIPLLTDGEQYDYGVLSGKYLKLLHTIPAPKIQEDWHTRFNRKTYNKIKTYTECGLKFSGDIHVINYLKENRDIFINRNQSFQHGDYHLKNMMIDNVKRNLYIIDFDRFDYGDPWEEFNRIVWCAKIAPKFAIGMIDGYFHKEPPIEFWKCLAFYIGSNTLSSIYWAQNFGEEEIKAMMEQANEVLTEYDNFERVIPHWYTR